jgi:hypothetical protein
MKTYAAGSLHEADRIVIESHLEICPECSEAIAALSRGATPGTRPVRLRPGVESTPWKRLYQIWTWPVLATPARLAGIIALIGCLFLVWAIWHRRNETAARANPGEAATPAQAEQKNATGSSPEGGAESKNELNAGAKDGLPGNTSPNVSQDSASMAVSLKDGDGRVGLDDQGTLVGIEGLGASEEAAVRSALATGKLMKPTVLKELTGPPIKLMDQSTNGLPFKLFGPIRTVVIDEHPVLRWGALAGAASYTVSVFDDQFERVAKSEPQSGKQWRVPIRLRRGQTYSWEVKALKDNQEITAPVAPSPRAEFKVLGAADARALNDAKKQRPGSHLTLGILYARLGLLNEGEREFGALARDNPDSALARKLLADVRSWRH